MAPVTNGPSSALAAITAPSSTSPNPSPRWVRITSLSWRVGGEVPAHRRVQRQHQQRDPDAAIDGLQRRQRYVDQLDGDPGDLSESNQDGREPRPVSDPTPNPRPRTRPGTTQLSRIG